MNNPTNSRNGWYDNGVQLKCGQKKCPNCGSFDYVESLSREKCNKCGLECDYWGAGANGIYRQMMYNQERRAEEARYKREREEQAADDYWRSWDDDDT